MEATSLKQFVRQHWALVGACPLFRAKMKPAPAPIVRLINITLATVFALHLLRSVAPAATVLRGPEDFEGSTTLVTFETFPGGEIVPYNRDSPGLLGTQWSGLGLSIYDSSSNDGAGAYSGTNGVGPHSGTRAVADSSASVAGLFIEFRFITMVREAGLWVQNGDDPSTVSFFDANGRLIQSVTTAVSDSFVGLRAPEGIASIRVNDSGFFMVDDLQFEVIPEPSGVALLACGAGILMAPFRRRHLRSAIGRIASK